MKELKIAVFSRSSIYQIQLVQSINHKNFNVPISINKNSESGARLMVLQKNKYVHLY